MTAKSLLLPNLQLMHYAGWPNFSTWSAICPWVAAQVLKPGIRAPISLAMDKLNMRSGHFCVQQDDPGPDLLVDRFCSKDKPQTFLRMQDNVGSR